MKNTLTIILSFLLIQTQAQYIYPDQEVAILIKSKDLIVQLLPESSGVEKALNKILIETFEEYWPDKNMKYMFYDTNFNKPLNSWNVSNVKYMGFFSGVMKNLINL